MNIKHAYELFFVFFGEVIGKAFLTSQLSLYRAAGFSLCHSFLAPYESFFFIFYIFFGPTFLTASQKLADIPKMFRYFYFLRTLYKEKRHPFILIPVHVCVNHFIFAPAKKRKEKCLIFK